MKPDEYGRSVAVTIVAAIGRMKDKMIRISSRVATGCLSKKECVVVTVRVIVYSHYLEFLE